MAHARHAAMFPHPSECNETGAPYLPWSLSIQILHAKRPVLSIVDKNLGRVYIGDVYQLPCFPGIVRYSIADCHLRTSYAD